MSYGEQFLWLQEGSGTADGASKRDRSAGGSNVERGEKRAAEPSQAQGAPRKKATPGPRVKNRICQVVGCDIEYSSTHECRARACQTHCSALSVRLEGQDPEQQFRFCYQCHKFHELDAFRNPDGTLRPRHNCYQSQALRLDRRKKKDAAAKASKKNLDIAAVLEAQSGQIIDAVNLARASNAGGEQSDPGQRHGSRQGHATDDRERAATPGLAPVAAAPAHDQTGRRRDCFRASRVVVQPGFFSVVERRRGAGCRAITHPSGPSLTAIDDKRRQRRATHVMGDAAGVTDLAARTAIDDKRHQRTMHGHPASGGDGRVAPRRRDGTRFEELSHVAPEETPQGRDGGEFSPDLLHSLLS